MDDTKRGDQGSGSSNTTMDQEVKGQSAKPQMEINEISARAFEQFYHRGETTGILGWDEIEEEIQLEAINIITELAIKYKKNNKDKDVRDTVPQEYHHLLDVCENGQKTTVPPYRPGIDLGIDLKEGKMVPIKKMVSSGSAPIIEGSTKLPRKIDTRYCSLARHWIDWEEPNISPNWISQTPSTTFESEKETNGRQPFPQNWRHTNI